MTDPNAQQKRVANLKRKAADENEPVDEAFVRSLGFTGPRLELDRLKLECGKLLVTHFNGFNVWWKHSDRAASRMIDNVTRRQLRGLVVALSGETST